MTTRLSWRLPPGWTAGPLEWPAPERIVIGPVTSFGYGGDVALPVRLTAPAGAARGRAVLRATADWLECAEICVPGKAELSIAVEVGARNKAAPRGAALIASARARVPRPDPAAALGASRDGDRTILALSGRHPLAEFFSSRPGIFQCGRSAASVGAARTELTLLRAPGAPEAKEVEGVLARPGLPPISISVPARAGGTALRHLLLAFLGGLLLNLMPCVFPVLSLKVLGLLQRAGRSASAARRHALAYAGGVILSFQLLAGGLLAARAAGTVLGWGFQLQSAPVVATLALLFIAIGLNLLGLFEVGSRWMGLGSGLAAREGYAGSFFSGVFAVVVAAPCTAPFMGAALGWALTRPAWESLAIFGALGAGTAAPYALFASWPALLSRLPRPGRWMDVLKRCLSIPMFATALWLLWVLSRLAAPGAASDAAWRIWSPAAVAQSRAAGRAVFVDFTAAWCLSCRANERLVLARPDVRTALAAADAYRADWTDRDPVIAAELAAHGRAGVPLYIVYPKGGEAVTLPEILTPSLVLEALGETP